MCVCDIKNREQRDESNGDVNIRVGDVHWVPGQCGGPVGAAGGGVRVDW